jgi:hypothetical protein
MTAVMISWRHGDPVLPEINIDVKVRWKEKISARGKGERGRSSELHSVTSVWPPHMFRLAVRFAWADLIL